MSNRKNRPVAVTAAGGGTQEPLAALRGRAELGDCRAQYDLGRRFELGVSAAPQSYHDAADWYHRSALLGNALAQYRLGVLLARGRVCAADPEAASRWCVKAARQHDQELLSVLHEEAEQGDPDAQSSLGSIYVHGKGVKQDRERGFKLWLSAASSFCPRASHNVAIAYEFGIGVAADMQQAVYWYRHAATRGVGRSAHRLARMYIEGTAVSPDFEQAKRLLRMAIALGWRAAVPDLMMVEKLGLDNTRLQ